MYRLLCVFLIVLLALGGAASAQGQTPLVAFVNSSGQVVVASGDGQVRWIVTNPGELLAQPVGYTWSPDGEHLLLAISAGGGVSLRTAEIASQTVREIGQLEGAPSGGEWTPDGNAVVVASGSQLLRFGIDGTMTPLVSGQGALALYSPFASDRPQVAGGGGLSPDGRYLFYWQSEGGQGRYHLLDVNSGAVTPLAVVNDANARQSGLWAERAPLVAYWGTDGGSSVLAVTHAASGQTVTLNSGRTVPVTPLAWASGGAQLIYRDTSNFIRLTDLSCLTQGGCVGSPLENGVELLPATASEVQIPPGSTWVYFRDGDNVGALDLRCANGGNCLDSIVTLGGQAVQRLWIHAAGNTLAYTAYTSDPNNPADREARVVDLRCATNPATCQPVALASQAVAGLVSPDGAYVAADLIGSGLHVLRVADRLQTYMSGSLGSQPGAGLTLARWG